MKKKGLLMTLMALMMGFVCNEAYAYDIAVENADGVMIYYNYINEGTELEVTKGGSYNSYSGSVGIYSIQIEHVMLCASRTIDVPECFACQVFYLTIIFGSF